MRTTNIFEKGSPCTKTGSAGLRLEHGCDSLFTQGKRELHFPLAVSIVLRLLVRVFSWSFVTCSPRYYAVIRSL